MGASELPPLVPMPFNWCNGVPVVFPSCSGDGVFFQSGAIWADSPGRYFIDDNARMPTSSEAALIAQGFAGALLDRV